MTLLTVNAGSTSVKLALFELDANHTLTQVRTKSYSSREDPRAVLDALRQSGPYNVAAIAHRIVHGGIRFYRPTVLNPAVIAANRNSQLWLRFTILKHCGGFGPHVRLGCSLSPDSRIDTAFFTRLPRVATEYAYPRSWARNMACGATGSMALHTSPCGKGWCCIPNVDAEDV